VTSSNLNPYSAEPVLEITLFFTCSNMGALMLRQAAGSILKKKLARFAVERGGGA
jgi:hypothetical protein